MINLKLNFIQEFSVGSAMVMFMKTEMTDISNCLKVFSGKQADTRKLHLLRVLYGAHPLS